MTHLALLHGIDAVVYPRDKVQALFGRAGAATRHEVARAIAARLTALSHRLPNKRRRWEPEDARQSLFDAAALAHTYYALFVRALKEARGTYQMPWHTGEVPFVVPTNAMTEHPYHGVNILSLWLDAKTKNYRSGYWASYKQWQSLGGQVRQGEHGSIIVFYKRLEQTELEIAAGELPRSVGRAYWVFNAAQIDNWKPPEPTRQSSVEINEQVAAFVNALDAKIDHGYARAQYRIDLDRIEMPSPSWFHATKTRTASEGYHSVLLHELTHWSGAAHRIGRDLRNRFGTHAYAFEELVAELGAAFLCASFGITNEPRQDHAAYVANWLEVLNDDSRAIFRAASRAQEAIEYFRNLAAEKLLDEVDVVPTISLWEPSA
jgi:antirestriction protein ArdC